MVVEEETRKCDEHAESDSYCVAEFATDDCLLPHHELFPLQSNWLMCHILPIAVNSAFNSSSRVERFNTVLYR
jgi:hypothetical protein